MIIGRQKLMDLLKKVLPAVNSRVTLPILGCVLMKVEPDKLTLDATDLGMRSVAWENMNAGESWCTAIPADFMLKLLQLIPDVLQVELKPKLIEGRNEDAFSKIVMRYGDRGVATFSVFPGDSFPALPDIDWQYVSDVDGSWLATLDQRIGFISDHSPTAYNPLFERVHLSSEGAIAVDRSRVAKDGTISIPGEPLHVLASSLNRAARMLAGETTLRLEMAFDNDKPKHVRLVGEHGFVSMDSEPVNMPDLARIFTQVDGEGEKLLFDRAPLMRYIKMASFKVPKDTLVGLCFDARHEGQPLAVYLHNGHQLDDSSDPVFAGPVPETQFFTALPLKQMRELVNAIEDPFIEVHYFGKDAPLRINGSENTTRFHVVAPLSMLTPRDVKVPLPEAVPA